MKFPHWISFRTWPSCSLEKILVPLMVLSIKSSTFNYLFSQNLLISICWFYTAYLSQCKKQASTIRLFSACCGFESITKAKQYKKVRSFGYFRKIALSLSRYYGLWEMRSSGWKMKYSIKEFIYETKIMKRSGCNCYYISLLIVVFSLLSPWQLTASMLILRKPLK